MIAKLLLVFSIFLNTIGFSQASYNIDKSLTQKSTSQGNKAEALDLNLPLPEIKEKPAIEIGSETINIAAKRYILIDSDSNTILAKKNENEKVPIASTTKIMTAAIVLEKYQLDDTVTISEQAANEIGATANFKVGEQITVENLLKCLLIKSANGAAVALAEHMNNAEESGTSKFVAKMNAKAQELNMNNTEYHDPAGLDTTGWSSAYDLTIITKYALKNEVFAEIVKTASASVTDTSGKIWHELKNSNRLVAEWNYEGAIGVKTGYMEDAGHCLVAAATRDGHTLISVVLFTLSDAATASAEESRKLLDWGWRNVTWNQ